MDIHFLSQKVSSPQYNYPAQTQPHHRAGNVNKYNSLAPLKSDTVSFGSAKFIVRPSSYRPYFFQEMTFLDILLEKLVLQNPELRTMGLDYYKVLHHLDSVKSGNFSICENIEHLVKSPGSIIGKIMRSGSFLVQDKIRATAYCDNPYNLDNFMMIITNMEKSGYSVAKVPTKLSELMKKGYMPFDEERMIIKYMSNPKNKAVTKEVRDYFTENDYDIKDVRRLLSELKSLGREPNKEEFLAAVSNLTKFVPDVDIRLDSRWLSPEQIEKLPEKYRYCIGKPQSSDYEDIQIRFNTNNVKYSSKNRKTPHELIILFGENYYKAKTRESTFVYSNTRKFKELTVKEYLNNPDYDRYTGLYKAMKEAIEKLFIDNISKKEFCNAKCLDFLKSEGNDTISFSKEDIDTFERNFKIIISEIGRPYEAAKKGVSKGERAELNRALAADRATLTEMRDKLRETINLYNNGKAYELTEPKPEPVKAQKKSKKSKKDDSGT